MSRTWLTADQLRGIALTSLIVGGFAAGWGIGGSLALPGAARVVALALVLMITLALWGMAFTFMRAARGRPGPSGQGANPFLTRDYQLAVLAEIIAIPLAGWLLTTVGRPDAVMSAVAAIVGLHFFGLVRAFQSWRFAVVGALMLLLALLSLALPPSVTVGPSGAPLGVRAAAVGLGCALLLWGGIASLVIGAWRQLGEAALPPAEDRHR